jgi:glycosyltransferase involved in cell wall biosynthesis
MVKVTVIIPTYNYALYISEAIQSVLDQTYSLNLIEIIVVDDGSIDNTATVLEPFIERGEVQYYYQENKGKANATKFGLKKSTGSYIFNLDADDYYLPNKIAETVAVFESDAEIVHIGTAAIFSTEKKWEGTTEIIPSELLGKTMNGTEALTFLYNKNILFGGGSTYAVRSSIIKQIDIPDGTDMYIDEFLILAVFPFGKTYFMEHPLSIWRVHSSNYSGSINTLEMKISKGERLLRSSKAVLDYMVANKNIFSAELVKIYSLIHLTREIGQKSNIGKKTIGAILVFGYTVFFKLNLKPSILKNHYVFSTLLPPKAHKGLKALKNKIVKPAI